jgi:hypothetical protein
LEVASTITVTLWFGCMRQGSVVKLRPQS